MFEASWSGELNSDITILTNLHHRKPVIICSMTKQQQVIDRKGYLCLLLKMRRIWFYRPFKPFSCTSLKMFPTIYFSTALGEYPVILVVPLHKNVSLRPGDFAKSWEQLDQTLPGPFQWLGLFRWRTAPGVTPNTHKHSDWMYVTVAAFTKCMLLHQYFFFLNRFAESLNSDNCGEDIYCLCCRTRHFVIVLEMWKIMFCWKHIFF